jgi:hypothetical protein
MAKITSVAAADDETLHEALSLESNVRQPWPREEERQVERDESIASVCDMAANTKKNQVQNVCQVRRKQCGS